MRWKYIHLPCRRLSNKLNLNQFYKDDLPPAIVVVGDHGMADGGGHGGSSDPEILVPFVLISQGIQVNNGFVRSGDFSSICPNISGYTGKQWVCQIWRF